MSTPYDAMPLAELGKILNEISAAYRAREAADAAAETQRKQRIAAAEATLVALLGPDNATAGQGSIREMLQYSDADLHEHSGLALRLVLTGMEIQTRTMLDLVRVVGQAG
mgnify:FL=1